MKKFVSVLLTASLLLSVLLTSAVTGNAINQPTISVGNVSGEIGSIVEVPINISDNIGIIALLVHIGYDSEKIELVGVEDTELFGTGVAEFGENLSANPYTMLWEDGLVTENHYENGCIAILKFRILSATNNTPITLTVDNESTFDKDLNPVNFIAVNGSVSTEAVHISAENVSGGIGSIVEVPINISNNIGIIALLVHIGYDSEKLELIGVEDTELFGTGVAEFGENLSANPYTMLWEDGLATENHTENGCVAILKFRILSVADNTPITLTVDNESTFDKDFNSVNFISTNGSVSSLMPKITASSVSGKVGETVDVDLILLNNPGIITMFAKIGYDSTKLKLVSVADTGLLGIGTAYSNADISQNPYTMIWEDGLANENYTENGIIATLTFEILEDASFGETPITIILDDESIINYDLQTVSFVTENGSVNIEKNIRLYATQGTGSVVDEERKIVSGLMPGLDSIDGYFYVDDADYDVVPVAKDGKFGTGSTVEIRKAGDLVSSYTVVIYGDVNGDSYYDGMDSVIVSCIVNGMLTREQVGEVVWIAADCDKNSLINEADVEMLNQAGLLSAEIQQTINEVVS